MALTLFLVVDELSQLQNTFPVIQLQNYEQVTNSNEAIIYTYFILAYDVHDNTDLFFKEAPDGVNVIIAGYFGKHTEMLAIVGGNSSVQAINWEGNEVFWNVVSGKVSSMITFDFDKDGENEVGS